MDEETQISENSPSSKPRVGWEFLKVFLIGLPSTMVLLGLFLTTLIWWDRFFPDYPVTAEDVLNFELVLLLTFAGLPLLQRTNVRWLWHVKDKPGNLMPEWNSEPTAPVPLARRTLGQRLLYFCLYVLAMAAILAIFGPLSHQQFMHAFLSRLSAGRHSYTVLVQLVFFTATLALFLITALATRGWRRKDAAGLLTREEALRACLNENWLFAFSMSFGGICLLCYLMGNMINLTLR